MKIKAFTMMEMVVALAIAAVVTSIGYLAFSAIGKVVLQKKEDLQAIEELQSLRFYLQQDFNAGKYWLRENDTLFRTRDSSLQYHFNEKCLTRETPLGKQSFSPDTVLLTFINHPRREALIKLRFNFGEGKEITFPVNTDAAYWLNIDQDE